MVKKYSDNFNSTRLAIAKRILADKLMAYARYGYTDRLTNFVTYAGHDDSWSYMSTEFERADTNCSLDVNVETVWNTRYEPNVDAEGNEWVEYKLSFSVNHPCHGSADAATVLARCELYTQVAMLAAELQAEFSGRREIWKLYRTAEKASEDKAKSEALKIQKKVNEIVRTGTKGMRKGSVYPLASNSVEGIPAGTYESNVDDKSYKLDVFGAGGTIDTSDIVSESVGVWVGCQAKLTRTA